MIACRSGLVADLRALGLPAGGTVLVHASLRRIGPIAGGPVTALAALRDVLGPAGTIMVPTQTAGNSITSPAFRSATAGMTPCQVAEAVARIPPFDPATSPAEGMGALAETVRRTPGALRSRHPHVSFAALGPAAAALTAVHDLECHLGERSPLGSLYAADALILLAGVDWAACTAFHLAEYRLDPPPPARPYRCYLRTDADRRIQREFLAPDLDDSDFPRIGARLDARPDVRCGPLGTGIARLLPLRLAVDVAGQWMRQHRAGRWPPRPGVAAEVSLSDGSGG
ncbi:aminoglycoside N(3)-acetyltransferase [Salinispora arenicola]|uniref:aminoglycoside N(3)-acetyltransferase n=1 Tax=Salinispora arenicola TaxID=168697 RepID=UPI00038042D6|nr:AAC(3) family N-acetyltransferase [Salinispora arenicola]NIL58539.1 AAC(3) family N-acetyltransferase [Salinispora arenicola]NIL60924.1 AAC(3) family N-acetyltransferase [Salinispora arenicola]